MAAILLLLAGQSTEAQTKPGTISADSLRRSIVKAVTQKLKKSHYSPKTIDDLFSGQVWDSFLGNLDPQRNIFLEEDIASLKRYRLLLDDEINSSNSVAFFDAAWKLYSIRIQEAKTFTEKALGQPFNFTDKEILTIDRKQSPYPLTLTEKEKLWHSFIKYAVIRNYAEMETAGNTAAIDPALEKKAREKVGTWYRRYFLQQSRESAINEKFSLYVNAITLNMDPHSAYTYPLMQDNLNLMVMGKFFGIGMELGMSEMDVVVKRLVPGGSAFKSGLLKENDRILAVYDNAGKLVPTADLELTDIAAMIRGEQGTAVTMLVMQPGAAERKVTIPREQMKENASKPKSAVINSHGKKIGYVYLPLFYMNPTDPSFPGCSGDVREELEKLRDQQVEGVVFDLRGNGGGSLAEVVRMGASFMPASAMSLLRGKEKVEVYTSPAVAEPQYVGPLAVLIDEGSASASEIFAAAIQDYHRGLVIGTSSTFGKGTSQVSLNLGKMGDSAKGIVDIKYGSLRITEQKFYRVTGHTTQLQGVKPDVVLAEKSNQYVIREADLPAVLPADTIAVQPVPTLNYTAGYGNVVINAQKRANANTSLQLLGKNMNSLKELQQSPVPLDLAGYMALKKKISEIEKQIALGRELQQSKLEVSPALYTRINPELQKQDANQQKNYNNWLNTLSKDLFLSEAVLLVQDMIDTPVNKK